MATPNERAYDAFEEMMEDLATDNQDRSALQLVAKLAEETGEVAREFKYLSRKKDFTKFKRDLESELGDVISAVFKIGACFQLKPADIILHAYSKRNP